MAIEIHRYEEFENCLLENKAWKLTESLISTFVFLVFLIFIDKIFTLNFLKVLGIILLFMFSVYFLLYVVGAYIFIFLSKKKNFLRLLLSPKEKQLLEEARRILSNNKIVLVDNVINCNIIGEKENK